MSSFVLKIKYNDDMRRISFESIPQFEELVKAVAQLFQLTNIPLIKYEDDEKDLVSITSDVELKEAFSVAKGFPLRITVIAANSKPQPYPSYKEPEPAPAPKPAPLPNFASNPFFESLSKMLQGIVDEKAVEDITQKLQSLGVNPEGLNYPDLSQLLQGFGLSGDIRDMLRGIYTSGAVTRNRDANNNNNNNNNANYGAMPRNHDNTNANNGVQTHVGVTCDGCQQQPLQGIRYQCTVCFNYDLCEKCEAKGAAVHDPNHPMVKIPVPFRHPAFAAGRGCPYKRNKQDSLKAQYIADVSIPDHTVLPSNAKFVKIWAIRNTGEAPWPAGAQLRFIGGDRLGANAIVDVPIEALAPGQEVNIAVEMVAPSHPGRYTSFWRLTDSFGNSFGQKLWADIFVEAAGPSPSAPNDAPAPAAPQQPAAPAPQQPVATAPVAMTVEPLSATPSELELVKKLEDMGFQGDLLAIVRKNRGDLLACIRQCLGI